MRKPPMSSHAVRVVSKPQEGQEDQQLEIAEKLPGHMFNYIEQIERLQPQSTVDEGLADV